jgi:hypothetical protein
VGGLPHRDWGQFSLCRFPSTWLLIHKSACSCAKGQDPCACEARVFRNEIGPVLCCGRHVSQTVSRITAAPACRPMMMKIIVPPEKGFLPKILPSRVVHLLTYLHLRCQRTERFKSCQEFSELNRTPGALRLRPGVISGLIPAQRSIAFRRQAWHSPIHRNIRACLGRGWGGSRSA